MKTATLLLIAALLARGATYTSVQTGHWNSTSTWSPSGVPGNGDVVRLADGVTVTIPSGYGAVAGTSPTDDAGTAAIACTSGTGTGVLVVSGTLTFRGPVNQCNSTWTWSPGSTILHDSSLAAVPASANYSWRFTGAASQTGAILNAVGTPESRITVSIAANSGNAGGLAPTTDASTDGTLNLQYIDIDHWGTASRPFVRIYPVNCSTTIPRGLTLKNFTLANSGEVLVSNSFGSCTVDVEDGVITGALYFRAISIGFYSSLNTALATNGVRRWKNLYVEGGSMTVVANGSNLWDLGLEFSNLYLRGGTSGSAVPFSRGGNVTVGASGTADRMVLDNRISSSSDTSGMPGGAVSRLVLLRNYGSNEHFVTTSPVESTIDGWLSWNSVGDVGSLGDVFTIPTTGSVNHNVAIKNGVMLRQPDGNATGALVNYNGAVACTGGNCPALRVENNTFLTDDIGGTGVVGVTQESNAGYAGVFHSIQNNLVHQRTNAAGWVTKWSSALGVAANAITTADYNWTFNVTGGKYHTTGSNTEYATTPGLHDRTGDPLFVETTRTPLSYAQRWDPAVPDMDGVAGKFKACFQWRANGSSACDARFLDIADMYNWIRAGWRTRNAATWTAGNTGGSAGGVTPDKSFGRGAAGGF